MGGPSGPPEVEDRLVPGHWEGDLIKGARNQSAVGTLVERTSRLVLLARMEGATAEAALAGFTCILNRVHMPMRKTLTYDQGKEMSRHLLASNEQKDVAALLQERIENPQTVATLKLSFDLLQNIWPFVSQKLMDRADEPDSSFWIKDVLNPLHAAMSSVHEIYMTTFQEVEKLLDKNNANSRK
jgi:hypothetical protein